MKIWPKNYDENSYKGYLLDVDFEKKHQNLYNDLSFLPERMKIKKCHKLTCNVNNKNIMLHR